jgi:Tfp pilus assembly protein PilN
MKTVNLLPGWYRQQKRRQRNMRFHAVAMVLLGAAMVGSTVAGRRELRAMNQRRDALAVTLHKIDDPTTRLRQASADLRRLEELRLARQELGNTVPMSAVIQQLQNDMTRGMALSNLSVEVRSEPIKGSGVVGDPKNPPRYRDVAHLSITGIAPDEGRIAAFIDNLSRNPLFADIMLDYTRTGELQRYLVRRFEIQLSMDLERLTSAAPDSAVAAGVEGGAASSLATGVPAHGE